ncbi:putative isoleucine--tRNA ligase, cytoplasmic [Echinococcus granulosus]|nr:putative isoleucine--tRNA ligase, cytoplasmic [Echinococcus granulosus]
MAAVGSVDASGLFTSEVKEFAGQDAWNWAFSRHRYWGTPIPVWVSEDFEEVVCIGSVDELERLSGHRVTDLRNEFVDPITIPSRMGKGELRHIWEVFDCGSMPYAQVRLYTMIVVPSALLNFVVEGVDQTSGWFYTLFVLSTALLNQPPFRNLIVNGADLLRPYLVDSPVVRAQSLPPREVQSIIEPWERAHGTTFRLRTVAWPKSRNLMDRWILSFTQSRLLYVCTELRAYRLYTVVPRLVCFIEQLVNWYIRRNHRRLKGEAPSALTENGATIDVEAWVAWMEAAGELGQSIRIQRDLPLKTPLPAAVVVHSLAEAREAVTALASYVTDKLNIR